MTNPFGSITITRWVIPISGGHRTVEWHNCRVCLHLWTLAGAEQVAVMNRMSPTPRARSACGTQSG
jgi:hypothetical protein